MLREKSITADVGIICARFQCQSLHQAHIELIESVIQKHSKVIIFLGLSPLKGYNNNPLDFEARKYMVLEKFPNVMVLYIKDVRDDEKWAANLDNQIDDLLGPNQTCALYGSRDSFIKHYKNGKYPTIELEPIKYISGTELRKIASNSVKATSDFRHGVIWSANNRYPSSVPTVDIGIIDFDRKRILMAKKTGEPGIRFVGGFSKPDSESYEIDAKRETLEETGLEVSDLTYIGSAKILDWRFEREIDKIKTLFFVGTYTFGCQKANDDIAEVSWHSFDELYHEDFEKVIVVPEHAVLVKMLKSWLTKNKRV